jgi:hypothetical protein
MAVRNRCQSDRPNFTITDTNSQDRLVQQTFAAHLRGELGFDDLDTLRGLIYSRLMRGREAALLVALGLFCQAPPPGPTDWSEFTAATVAGSLHALALAEDDYFQRYHQVHRPSLLTAPASLYLESSNFPTGMMYNGSSVLVIPTASLRSAS